MLLPGVTMNNDINKLSSILLSVWLQHPVHEVLKGGGGPKEWRRKIFT